MNPRMARLLGSAGPTFATTPNVVAPYPRMQSITVFARSGGSMSACNNSAYGRCAHNCTGASPLLKVSRNVPGDPAYGPMYAGDISFRTLPRIVATSVSCKALDRLDHSSARPSNPAVGFT